MRIVFIFILSSVAELLKANFHCARLDYANMASAQNNDPAYARQTAGAEAEEESNDKNRAGPTWSNCAGGEICRKQKIVSTACALAVQHSVTEGDIIWRDV